MKPLKLMMQAFGPYADKEIIDFTKLGNRTMFVISGKTGSGKTTIFDGISYAIYGKASGEDRNGTDLRSQFSEDDLATEVSLEFSLRNKTYYIWRSPQQEKKKARGDGYTTIGAKAELYVINEDGNKQLLAANVRDTDEKIKEIVQLDSNQFRQILMIPQGEFRKLLTSDSKDKEMILQRLFHTELYKKIEEQLKEESSSIKKIVEAKVDERSQYLRSIFQIDNEPLKRAIEEEIPNDLYILSLLAEEIVKMKHRLDEMNKINEEKKNERDAAKKRLDDAEALLQQFENKKQLQKKKEELLSQKNQIDQKKKEIEDAYKASRLEQQDLLCHRLKKEYDSSHQDFINSNAQLTNMVKTLELAEKQYKIEEGKTEKRQQLADDIFRLTNLKEEIYSLADRQEEVTMLEQQQKTLELNVIRTKQQIMEREKELDQKRSNQKALEDLRIKMFENEKKLERLSTTLQKLMKLQALSQKENATSQMFETKKMQFENVLNRLTDAKNTFSTLEHHWQMGQAGLLAEKLISGQPCPVCGSTNHPQPARNKGAVSTENDLKAAKKSVEKIEVEKTKAETDWLEMKATYSALKTAIAEQKMEVVEFIPDFSLENLEPYRNQFHEKHSKLLQMVNIQKDQLANVKKLENEIGLLENHLKRDRENLETQQELEKETSKRFIEKKTAIEKSRQNIPEDIRTKEQFNKKVTEVGQLKKQLEDAFERASKQLQQAKEMLSGQRARNEQLAISRKNTEDILKQEREKFLSMLEEQGFSGYQQFSQAKRSFDSIKQLEQEVQLYGEELRSVSDRYQEIVVRLANIEQPRLDILQQQFRELEKNLLQLTAEQTNMLMNIRHNENILERVNMINDTIKVAEEQYQLIGHLSDMARGQNTYRITFERYVLAAFLDDILYVANTRLTKMTGGRYHLLRKTDRSKGNVQSGLELLIFDQYTGQERHVKTLSGGESFKAALALALGLADVVQQYAGGVSLETMFIDEGFGTLDPESLDHAIEALMDIQSSGRLVGIISHVPELKERIDARLEVISGQNGSRTDFQFLG